MCACVSVCAWVRARFCARATARRLASQRPIGSEALGTRSSAHVNEGEKGSAPAAICSNSATRTMCLSSRRLGLKTMQRLGRLPPPARASCVPGGNWP
eukprot:7157263-Pyramimonas_sp.AAC.1